jgi:hypothetical protein
LAAKCCERAPNQVTLLQQSTPTQGKIGEETILHRAHVGSPHEELVADQLGIGRRLAQSPAK